MLLRSLRSGLLVPPTWASSSNLLASSTSSLHQIEFCASLHRPAGMKLPLVGHQFPLDRLARSRDFALVVDDGPTQLTRISLSRAICPGLDQEVSTSLRWDPVVDGLGLLLLQQQRLEILWHRRGCRGGNCTRWIVMAPPKPRVSLSPWHPRCVAQRANGNLGTHAQSRQQDSEVEGAWQLRFESNHCERAGVCCCDVCWVSRCRPVACRLSKTLLCPYRGFASHPLVTRYHQSSFRSVVLRI